MPALEIPHDVRPALGHVNLMVDTYIANAGVDDLRATLRSLLATNPPSLATDFTAKARHHLRQSSSRHPPANLFTNSCSEGRAAPTTELDATLARVRSLYGAGMGFESLSILSSVVRATIGTRWEENDDMAQILAAIDTDISQAIQSSREEIGGGRVSDLAAARGTIEILRSAVRESFVDVEAWGGEFPFERASASLEFWKL